MTDKELEKEYWAGRVFIPSTEWLIIFPSSKKYIKDKIKSLSEEIRILRDKVSEKVVNALGMKRIDDKNFTISLIKTYSGASLCKKMEQKERLKKYIRTPTKSDISPEMVERAKNYDFNNLIEFNRGGFCSCFAHKDTHPSMHLIKEINRVFCFSCLKGWDTIQFLRDRDGLSFQEAVRRLQ